jgi:hypothetical protein
LPGWVISVVTPLVTPGAVDPWLEPAVPPGADDARVVLEVPMTYQGPDQGVPGAEQFQVPERFQGVVPAEGALLQIETAAGLPVVSVTTQRERPSFVALPAGVYRVRYSHPAAPCEPAVFRFGIFPEGLPTEAADVLELPVLANHTTQLGMDCFCVASAPAGSVLDLATCTIAPADAGVP